VSGVVGTLDPAGRRLLLIPRRPAPETLAPAPAAESEPGAAGKDRAAAGGEAKAAEEASGKLGAGAWWRLVAGGGRTGRGWGFVVRLQEAPPRGSRTRRLLAATRTGEVGAPGFGFGSGLRLRVGCATTVWGGFWVETRRDETLVCRDSRGSAFFESPGSGTNGARSVTRRRERFRGVSWPVDGWTTSLPPFKKVVVSLLPSIQLL
jgi:hypothetical protein